MPSPLRAWIALPVLLVVATACGSTVQQSSVRTTTLGGSSLGAPDQGLSAGSTTTTPVGASGSSTTLPGTTSAAAPRRSTPSAGPAVPARGSVSVVGRGWDAKYVYLGVVTQKDTRQVFASFGAKNVDPGDTEAQAQAAADALNRRGGLLGRQLKLRFMDIGTIAAATNPDQVGNEVCNHFTQDAPVVALTYISTQIDVPSFRACLAHARIPLFSVAARAIDDKTLTTLSPYFFHAMMVSWDALAPVLVARLTAQGWFQAWDARLGRTATSGRARVGILVDGTPSGAATARAVKGALARSGHSDALVYAYSDPSKGQSSSVQYFSGNGVTHVIVTDVELTAFQNSASTQGYRPRYGITTYNDPYSNLEASGLTPGGQNNGAMGVGWAPNYDVSDQNDPGRSPGAGACTSTMAKHGQRFSGNQRLARAYAFAMCDVFGLVVAGASASGGLAGTAIGTGIAVVGPRFPVAQGFGPALTGTKPYVNGIVRDLAWSTSCGCMRYGATSTRL